jgi:hypothetical protein
MEKMFRFPSAPQERNRFLETEGGGEISVGRRHGWRWEEAWMEMGAGEVSC